MTKECINQRGVITIILVNYEFILKIYIHYLYSLIMFIMLNLLLYSTIMV